MPRKPTPKKQIETLTTELADLRGAFEDQHEEVNRWKDEAQRERQRANECGRWSAQANRRAG